MATLGFLLVLAAASDDVEAELESPKLSCFRRGWGYEDSWHKDLNGGFVANAETCQETCDHMWFCDVFTYYEDTKKCFLQGNQAIEMVKTTAISGPKTCSATSLSEALKMVKHAGWSAAKGAQAEAMNLQQIKIAGVQAVQQNGVKLGLSNTQKAQVTAGVVGMIAAVKAAGDGNRVSTDF
ncbi:unnamed protein product [Effrenium voratum]|uniref:Apple domain-containing protein n=1 Tax=Effrenium voratum TaxID=2562239 RepID=A0AA36JPW0_9DINO|nr:unnamed protein product [Effrenium voratum]CAJ1462191.1 unnamed protein product [Effrenium voratum]